MEIVKNFSIDFKDGELYGLSENHGSLPIEHNSLGGLKFSVGDIVAGIVIDSKVVVVNNYKYEEEGGVINVYGYITKDEITSENISIFVIICFSKESLENNIITIKRDNVLNYE